MGYLSGPGWVPSWVPESVLSWGLGPPLQHSTALTVVTTNTCRLEQQGDRCGASHASQWSHPLAISRAIVSGRLLPHAPQEVR